MTGGHCVLAKSPTDRLHHRSAHGDVHFGYDVHVKRPVGVHFGDEVRLTGR
jgi:hypothetical protein